MKRRAFLFFSSMLPLSLLDRICKACPDGWEDEVQTAKVYKDWWIYWTGWKMAQSVENPAGQWIAYPLTDPEHAKRESGNRRPPPEIVDGSRDSLYSSFPGECRSFKSGDAFHLTHSSPLPKHWWISGKIREKMRRKALKRLIKLIDSQ